MLKLLEEAIAFIEEQNKWIDQIKSCIAETEKRNKGFHSIICSTLMKEMEKLKQEKMSSSRQRTKFIHHENVQTDGRTMTNDHEEVREIQQDNNEQDRSMNVHGFPFNSCFSDEEFELKPNQIELNTNFIPQVMEEEDPSYSSHNEVEYEYETMKDADKNESVKVKEENLFAFESNNTNVPSSSLDNGNSSLDHKITVKSRKKIAKAPRRSSLGHGHLYQCTLCQKAFRYKCRLVVHMRRHTGEKPFPCNICNRTFRTNHELSAHLRTHAAHKSFASEIYNKTIPHSDSPTNQELMQTGEKPFKCSFNQKQSLIEHENQHTDGH